MIFKGHLPISRPYEIENFVDYVLKIRRADFMETLAPHWSNRLVQYAKGFAQKAGRLYEYHQSAIDKAAWAKEQIETHQLCEGLVGVLCVVETCMPLSDWATPRGGLVWCRRRFRSGFSTIIFWIASSA